LQVLLLLAVSVAIIALVLWSLQRHANREPSVVRVLDPSQNSVATIPSSTNSERTPESVASPASSPTPENQSGAPSPSPGELNSDPASQLPAYEVKLDLIVPVQGVSRDQLRDTFNQSRAEVRTHDAIDIMAPAGTPVLAADDGKIIRLFESKPGGTTIYQHSSRDKKIVFYYAHLQRYAEGLAVGKFVRKGEVIAYVGDTGNAGAGNFHLHFSVLIVSDPKRAWAGRNINPYPLLPN